MYNDSVGPPGIQAQPADRTKIALQVKLYVFSQAFACATFVHTYICKALLFQSVVICDLTQSANNVGRDSGS